MKEKKEKNIIINHKKSASKNMDAEERRLVTKKAIKKIIIMVHIKSASDKWTQMNADLL